MKYGLPDAIIESIQQVLETNPKLDKALLFGSRAKGNYRDASDIDLTVKGQNLNYDNLLSLNVKLDDLNLPYKVDLIDYHSIKEPALTEHIDRVGIEFYSRWKECELGEIINLKRGYDLPNSQRRKGIVPIISSSGVTDYHDTPMKAGPGVITGRYGTIGQIFYTENSYWPLNTTLYVQDFKGNHPKFIFYFLKGFDFEKYSDKSAVPGINRNELHKEKILSPPLSDQIAIASTLSSLDDKIDLLGRQNKTLEQLAETLFRQWFVEDVEESWENGTVLDLFVLQRGHDLPSQSRTDGKYPIISSGGISGYHHEHKVKGPGVVTGRSGMIGNVFFVTDDFWPLNTSLFIKEYRIGTPIFSYFFLKTLDLPTLNGGSAVPTLNRNDVHDLSTTLPPKQLVENFEKIASDYFKKIETNRIQITTLTYLRDALLPKLMSGEVKVNFNTK